MDRDAKGRFLPGHPDFTNGRGGRPPGTLTEALRKLVNPDDAAKALTELAQTATQQRVRLEAWEVIWDRLEGKAPQTVDMNLAGGITVETIATLLPDVKKMLAEEKRE